MVCTGILDVYTLCTVQLKMFEGKFFSHRKINFMDPLDYFCICTSKIRKRNKFIVFEYLPLYMQYMFHNCSDVQYYHHHIDYHDM